MVLEWIATDKGNQVLESLKAEGWRVKAQYSPFAFDKGIDYDSYELVRAGDTLKLEWDNWLEWRLSGAEPLLQSLKHRFAL
ncbi:hypothetical protein MJ923_03690 [Shewanella sp. 3B26]|jgi:hypothetical protein|uniref:Uncharacterized protein n=1 Tax=Shewanella zhuhaiensis TaxID=2919576 RepID=A0AAJ1F9Q4_9GAMM|nr:hypothetical protein [Shewanella zhuhaiensis]MCH4293405.1 hypothetical protein [Shewanella zhuhaiensis]